MDLNYAIGYSTKCDITLCCRVINGLPTDPADAAGYWGHMGGCDIPKHSVN